MSDASAKRTPYGKAGLTLRRERELCERVSAGCRTSLDRLVLAHLSFVARVARSYSNLGVPFDDLLSEGAIGLIEAAGRFDSTKNVRFLTYAGWWVRKRILRAIHDCAFLVRVPDNRLRRAWAERREQADYRGPASPPRDATAPPLPRTVSLDQPSSPDDPRTLGDRLTDATADDQSEEVLRKEGVLRVGRALEALTTQERMVIVRRFGLDRETRETLRELGGKLGVSRERVRQIESTAKSKLKRSLERSTSSARVSPGTW